MTTRRRWYRSLYLLAAGLCLVAPLMNASSLSAQSAGAMGFHLDRLPRGKNVTIPKPATTFVPLTSRIQLTATDMPQSISFRPVNLNNGQLQTIRLAIYDPGSERVRYVDVKPGTPFLYAFRKLSSITVIPDAKGGDPSLKLQVESNKPLQIAH